MREVLLNGKHYKIAGEILQRAISPWKATITSNTGREYSSFQSAELEEYHDLRNGIGLESENPNDSNRLWWSEGIDFSTARSAVLGSLVTTAGAFGVAPVKIIDFQGATYAIGNSKISKWNTGTSAWDSKDTSLANPIDAIVVTDATDEYLIVSSAQYAIYTSDGTTWANMTDFMEDFTVFTEADTNNKLTVTALKALGADVDQDEDVLLYRDMGADKINALDVDFEIYLNSTSDTGGRGGIAISSTANVDMTGLAATDIVVSAWDLGATGRIHLARGNDVAVDNYDAAGVLNTLLYCTLTRVASADTCTVTIYSDAARTTLLDTLTVAGYSTTTYRYIYGFINYNVAGGGTNFDGYVQNLRLWARSGYMDFYNDRLYFISTDGKDVTYSVAKDIDDYSGKFTLTGNFGTVYDLFEGKLLSDGTPVLYFCGTQGLFTIDTTNEKAYKQEVAYPPLTYAGHRGMYWNANVWVATGYGILKVASGSATYEGPDQDDGLPSGYQGYVYDMATVNNWLIFCVNGGSTDKSSILKRNSSLGGNLQVYTTSAVNKAITCLCHSPSSLYTNGRLWFGEGTDVKYMMFPDTTSNVKQIATYTYVDDSGYGILPTLRKLATISKTALGVAAITKSCDDNEYVEVFYGLNGAAATTSLGTFKTSPKPTTLTFGSGLGTAFYTIQLAIKLYRGTTTTNSPELESLMFYYLPTPATISAFTLNIQATEDTANQIITELEAVRDTNTLVAFYPSGDATKTGYNVKLTTMPLRFYHENRTQREGYVTLDLQEVFKG